MQGIMAANISLYRIETFHFYQVCCAFYCKGLTNPNDLPLNSNEIVLLIYGHYERNFKH